MSMKGRISVIIPTYNRAGMLREAIQSVLDQDYLQDPRRMRDLELLVVDDGSTDDTRGVVREFGGRAAYVFMENRGISAARNLGLRETGGEFVAFLDSDDLWKEDKLSVQMNYLKTFPDAVMCYTEETWVRNGRFVNPRKKHRKYSGWVFERVLPLCLLSLSAALFRRRAFEEIGYFDEGLPVCEDYDWGIRLAQSYPWHLIKKPLIVKRGGHADQLSRRFHSMDIFRIQSLEKALSLDLSWDQRRQVREEIVKKARILVLGMEKRGKTARAGSYRKLIEIYSEEEER